MCVESIYRLYGTSSNVKEVKEERPLQCIDIMQTQSQARHSRGFSKSLMVFMCFCRAIEQLWHGMCLTIIMMTMKGLCGGLDSNLLNWALNLPFGFGFPCPFLNFVDVLFIVFRCSSEMPREFIKVAHFLQTAQIRKLEVMRLSLGAQCCKKESVPLCSGVCEWHRCASYHPQGVSTETRRTVPQKPRAFRNGWSRFRRARAMDAAPFQGSEFKYG